MKQDSLTLPIGSPSSSNADEINWRDYSSALRRKWPIVAVIALVVFSLVAFTTLRQRRIYSATSKVVVASKKNGNLQVGSVMAGALSLQGGTAQTQVEIINSPDLIRKAYDALPVSMRNRGFQRDTVPSWSYEIRALKDTDVILIDTSSYDPQAAAAFANLIAEKYLELDLQRNSQATRQGREYVERERDITQRALGRATQDLAIFKQQSGIIAPAVQVTQVAQSHARLQDDLYSATSEDSAARLRLQNLKNQLKGTQLEINFQRTLAENPEYGLVRNQVVQLQNQLSQVSQTFTPGSPERENVERQLASAQLRLEKLTELSVATTSIQRNPVLDELLKQYGAAQANAIVASARLSAIRSQAANLGKELQTYPEKERRYADLQQRVDVLKQTYDLLSQRYFTLLIEERSSMPNGVIAAKAEAPTSSTSPNVRRNLALGLFLALFLGLCGALVANFFDNKLHQPDNVERLTGLATLALVPEIEEAKTPDGNLYVGVAAPVHAFMESFRMLRNNLTFVAPDRKLTALAVTSSSMGEGKSTISSNLAIALAMDSRKVLLIEADLRKPTVHTKMRANNFVGLSNVVRGFATLEEAIQGTEWIGLDCLTSGPLPPDPTEFLNSERARQVLQQARESYDVVILDSPPCIGLSDMQVISGLVDGVLLVVALERAPKQQVQMALRMLHQAEAILLGTAINRVDAKKGTYGYYGYYQQYYGESVSEVADKEEGERRPSRSGKGSKR